MADDQPAWSDLRVLLEVHRRRSFLAAGQALGLATATVARRIAALEAALTRTLVQRTSQGTLVAKDGLDLVAIAEELERSLAAYGRDGAGPSPYAGVVRLSIPDGFMPAAIQALAVVRRAHPETFVEVSAEARFVDLTAREADIGVRGARSTSAVLIERVAGDVHAGIFASAGYLRQRLPARYLGAGDWASQDFITGDGTHGPTELLRARGAVQFPVKASTLDGRLDAAENGLGLVLVGVSVAASRPRLVRVRLDTPLPPRRFYIVMHQELRGVPRMRAVADALRSVFLAESAKQAKAEERFLGRRR